MKTLKKVFIELTLPLLVSWFLMTVLVDIFTVPAVFRNSSSIVDAGKIGMTVFSRFNIFENAMSLLICVGFYFSALPRRYFIFSLFLFIWSLNYTFIMTPAISNITFDIHKTLVTSPQYAILQTDHAFYHNLYRKLDSTKLVSLLIFIILVIRQKIKVLEESL